MSSTPFPPSSNPPPPPPQIVYVQAPPPPRRGFFRAIFKTLAGTIIALSIVLNVYLLLFLAITHGKGGGREKMIEQGDPTTKIAVLSVDGIITDSVADTFKDHLKRVEDDSDFRAIVVNVDTPGGSVTASDVIYHALLNYKARTGRPVVISQGGMATSGGYYVSCAGDDIIAQPTTLTGNIGVLLERFNVSQLFDKWGVAETTLRSTGSPFKNAESMFKPESPEANAYLQQIVDDLYGQFKTVVTSGRAGKLKAPIEQVASGKVFTANQALALGLVDRVDYPEAAYAMAATRAGINKPSIVKIEDTPNLLKLLSSASSLPTPGGHSNTSVQIDGVNIDADTIADLVSARPMMLWEGR